MLDTPPKYWAQGRAPHVQIYRWYHSQFGLSRGQMRSLLAEVVERAFILIWAQAGPGHPAQAGAAVSVVSSGCGLVREALSIWVSGLLIHKLKGLFPWCAPGRGRTEMWVVSSGLAKR